ncbi:hypothetical protein ACFE04_021375 [Oxalis oulophora]
MSSTYPVLGGRPINQWKVIELKKELKRRKLTVSGLKADLIKRLDKVLCLEKENDQRKNYAKGNEVTDTNNGSSREQKIVLIEKGLEEVPITKDEEDGNVVSNDSNKSTNVDNVNLLLDTNDSTTALDQEKDRNNDNTNNVRVEQKPTVLSTNSWSMTKVSEPLVSQLENDNLSSSFISDEHVSEVIPNLGIHIKSDSICTTDSVPFNENINVKDNVKIELDYVIKSDIVGPSSTDVDTPSSRLMDVEQQHEKDDYAEDKDDKIDINANKYDSPEEKLNLNRCCSDDSMKDDILESKEIDEVGKSKTKNDQVLFINEGIHVDDLEEGLWSSLLDNNSQPTIITDKRKQHAEEAVGNNEPVKRQHRWNSESVKNLEQQISSSIISEINSIQSHALRCNYSRPDSTTSVDVLKEHIVPPSQKTATNCLRIDRFQRPFTLKAVQEMLGKTGTVTSFWMDQIKTHCYVTYSLVEDAIETRNVVYNLQWPPNGGNLLVAEFVDPEEVKIQVAPTINTSPVNVCSPAQPSPSSSQAIPKHFSSLPTLPLLLPPPALECQNPLPSPLEKVEDPIATLDDLFCKTKAFPRIYFIPLSEQQVTARSTKNTINL